jgi:hypothetical protein
MEHWVIDKKDKLEGFGGGAFQGLCDKLKLKLKTRLVLF